MKLQTNIVEIKKLVDWISDELHIKHLDDWYRVSLHQISKLSSVNIYNRETLSQLLTSAYPEHNWDIERINSGAQTTKPTQRLVAVAMRELFPTHSKEKNNLLVF